MSLQCSRISKTYIPVILTSVKFSAKMCMSLEHGTSQPVLFLTLFMQTEMLHQTCWFPCCCLYMPSTFFVPESICTITINCASTPIPFNLSKSGSSFKSQLHFFQLTIFLTITHRFLNSLNVYLLHVGCRHLSSLSFYYFIISIMPINSETEGLIQPIFKQLY